MLSERQEAAAPTAAPKNTLQGRAYHRPTPESTAKLQVGTLLLALQSPLNQRQRKTGYRLLELLISARYAGGRV